jgi:hypothetical protein
MSGGQVLIFIIFLILKLVGLIDWSWWWVTAPLWLPAAVGILLSIGSMFIILVVAILAGILSMFFE